VAASCRRARAGLAEVAVAPVGEDRHGAAEANDRQILVEIAVEVAAAIARGLEPLADSGLVASSVKSVEAAKAAAASAPAMTRTAPPATTPRERLESSAMAAT
jgi:hypothetical protein